MTSVNAHEVLYMVHFLWNTFAQVAILNCTSEASTGWAEDGTVSIPLGGNALKYEIAQNCVRMILETNTVHKASNLCDEDRCNSAQFLHSSDHAFTNIRGGLADFPTLH